MKTVLAISDSVEGTPYDLKRTTQTIKDFKMDPILVVPAIFEKSGNHFVNPSEDVMEYVFSSECSISAITIGYLTEQSVIENTARKLREYGRGKSPIIYQPSLITDDGEIIVSEENYYAICDNLISTVDLIIINRFEAELLSEIECHDDGDFANAAREISKQYKCSVLIRHISEDNSKNLLFNGVSSLWINTPPHLVALANIKYNLMSAVACAMAEKPLIGSAIRNGIYFCSIDKNKNPNYEQELVQEQIEYTPAPSVETMVSEPISEPVVETVQPEPVVEVEPQQEIVEVVAESAPVEETKIEIAEPVVVQQPVVSEQPVVPQTPAPASVPSGKISAADAIAAAKKQSGLMGTRAPLKSTPVPKFGANSILGSKNMISAPAAPAVPSNPNTTTSSLVSPVKTLRDIARTLDTTIRDAEEPAAITSTIEKPAPGPKAPVMDLTPDSSAVKIQALRDRLNNIAGLGNN